MAAFSAILAVGVWINSISNEVATNAKEQQREHEGRAAAERALARADALAAARDLILARNLEEGLRRAGLGESAAVLRDIRLGRRPASGPGPDIASIRRIAELETEQRLQRERVQAEGEAARAASQSLIRRMCERDIHRNDRQCVELRRAARQEAILGRLEGNTQ
jgi:hypothetical protein